MDSIKVRVTGRLTRDPERKEFNGDEYTEVHVAANQGTRENQQTLYFRARVYGRLGEIVAESGHKGREVTVEGKYKFGTFQKQDGSTGYSHEIQYADVNLHGSGRNNGEGGDNSGGYDINSDDIPF